MRKLNILLLAVLLFAGMSALYSEMRNPCTEPLRYSIGAFDARFGLTQKEFRKAIADAEAVWERPAGKDLFVYDAEAKFRINLIYDERQKRTDEYVNIKNQLESSETRFKSIEEEYASLLAEYDAKKVAFDSESNDFERDLAGYNREVDRWNERGGAPQAEFEKLKAAQAELDVRANSLEGDRQELNAISRRINILTERGNSLAENYNTVVSTYNQKFGTSTEFDQGDYRGSEINVYQFKELSDLRMVVAHEFGHALGIDHVDDSAAVMHYFMGEQNLSNLAATPADVAALSKACRGK